VYITGKYVKDNIFQLVRRLFHTSINKEATIVKGNKDTTAVSVNNYFSFPFFLKDPFSFSFVVVVV